MILRSSLVQGVIAICLVAWIAGCQPEKNEDAAAKRQKMIDRAKALELKTEYVAPPGNPLEHHAAGFAKIMCSAVFITGLEPDFAAENVGYFTAPYDERAKLGKPVVDWAGGHCSTHFGSDRQRNADD